MLRTIDGLRENVTKCKAIRRATPMDHFLLHEFLRMSIDSYERTIDRFAWFLRDNCDATEGVSIEEVARELAKQALFEAAESIRGRR